MNPAPIVEVVDYNPAWPAMFESEAQAIRQAIGDRLAGIEHIGSTAVPGLKAKPIIDLVIATHDLSDWPRIEQPLKCIGYLRWTGSKDPSRCFFAKGTPQQPRTHHLMLVEKDSRHWQRAVIIRDYFRKHFRSAQAYEEIKRTLSEEFPQDRGLYTAAKWPHLDWFESRARNELATMKLPT